MLARAVNGTGAFFPNGALDEAAAQRNRLSEHDVLEDLRLNGNVAEMREVLLAVLERNGHISVVRRSAQ